MSGLHIRADAPWRADLISECLRFPAGVHDDQVDALGLAGQLLDRMQPGAQPPSPEQPAAAGDYRPARDTAPADDAWMTA